MTSSTTLGAYIVGMLLLFHSGYSAYEFHSLASTSAILFDIIIETIVAVIIIVYGAINSITNDASLSLDNTIVEPKFKFLKPIPMDLAVEELESLGVSDYSQLENRLDFINIAEKRAQFAKWVESND